MNKSLSKSFIKDFFLLKPKLKSSDTSMSVILNEIAYNLEITIVLINRREIKKNI